MVEAEALDRVERHPAHGAGRARLLAAGRLDPGLGDGAEVGDEVAGRAVRLAPRPGGRQLGQPREAEQPLGDLRLGGEEPLAAQADLLDQPPHEDVGAALLHHRGGGVVELQEGADPLPRLGLELGRVERRLAGGDHVLLAAAGDRRQPRQVAGAQLDRRPGQRPRRRGRVVGVGEHPQPGDRVAHLGPLEQRRRPGEVEGDAALLHRRGDRAALAAGSATTTQISSAAVPAATRCSTSRATACAWARSLPQRQKRSAGSRKRCSSDDRRRRPGGGRGTRPRASRRRSPRQRVELVRASAASAASSARCAGVVSSSSSTITCAKRAAISRRTSGRSTSRQSRARKTSPRSRLPAAARMRSWAV